MKYSVVLAKGVDQELEEAVLWLESNRLGAGRDFLDEFDRTIAYLSSTPKAFSVKYKSCREVKIGRFYYILIFEVVDNIVYVVKLIHTSRNPQKRYPKR